MNIELFVFPVNGQKVAATRAMLEAQGVSAEGGEQVFKDAVVALFEDKGEWHTVTLKDNWTGADDLAVKAAIRRWDANSRQYLVDDLRFAATLVGKAVTAWTFPNCPVSPEGFLALPSGVGDVLFSEVHRCLYPTLAELPNFLQGKE